MTENAPTSSNVNAEEEVRSGVWSSVPALPAPSDAATTLQVGETVSLEDRLGPLVVNADGSLSRIANWENMTEAEKANTLRVLGRRNGARLANLNSMHADDSN
ncbi:hypothetical protein GUITHDRAFT_101081 [Guillardia theta CCMP2712]|uniref:Uncharacterized protein n=2 Tax=Guillardia theta TaxID=55529 RepID=L1JYE4_GUITC|nr:hypothetical protein GUITHDRAFT_101081 [Guillardia theta CCMP2712]EKX53377.1 hypothetical protein GUITHDRAFT_101081 [Guillardia theta CCMP2712]|mmetsp:Transcript_622/g.1647  ORF Transcript_622/g.1647 Transcript_622/m.1647 type:complete len:103 (+) Transcript_622:140-448(+)|eukprot:XP_005840357.1 hypothetical protein GUITHDRAFT_101081 [Guillardia theta CCMP2712]